jgi:predicted esterase
MRTRIVGYCVVGLILLYHASLAQVDTTYVYRTGMPYGTLDIRIAKSATRYYYLEEGKTFSFRESSPGVKTNSFRDMTSWDSSPYTQGNLREKNGTSNSFVMNYRLLYPGGYQPGYAEGYPLIVMVHGLGERGNCWNNNCYWGDRTWKPQTNTPAAPTTATSNLLNNDHNLLHGGQTHLAMRNNAGTRLPDDPSLPSRSFQGFVLFPQNLNGWDANSAQDVIKLVRLISKKYNINEDRIYIHGLSNGGAAVYEIIKRAPWLFSAAATMSAVSDGGLTTQNLTGEIVTIPIWTFQGGLDKNPTPAKTSGYVKKFREAGLTVRYNLYPNLGHGTWGTAYNEPDFFLWFRSKHKSTVHVFADNPTLCSTTGQGVKLDLAKGFLAYQWERNGVIISGATSAQYIATSTGTYRARFSRISRNPTEAQWNEWSAPVTVTSSSPPQAEILQTGTVLLKDLNNFGDARLHSAQVADHYYWYKNGVRIDLPGTLDDTTRHPIIKQGDCSSGTCTGNGVYTLVTAGFNNCPSPVSEPVHIYFNNQAPINIPAPTSFTGSATSGSTATLNWADASSNEIGFEIWRRKQITSTTFGKWEMPVLTGANVRSYTDGGLVPNSTYQYKIRAVGTSGRSNYTPSASNQYLIINTLSDSQAPTTPTNLTATNTAIKEITLKWNGSTDNAGIRDYVIYYGSTSVSTGTPVTTYTLKNLPLNANFTFTVKARDLGGNLSGSSNAASANTFVEGLYYEHSTGAWTDLDQINWSIAEFKGKVSNFTLGPRTQEDYFNFEFDGYLYLNNGGSYQFQLSSDDGSRLTIDGTILVDNDGAHTTITKTSALVTLGAGAHTINVKYFEDTGNQNLTVRYKGPDTGNSMIVIPNAALRSGNSGSTLADESMMATTEAEPESLRMSTTEEPETEATLTQEPVLTVYPNPSTTGEDFTAIVESGNDQPVSLQVMSLMGRIHFQNVYTAEEFRSQPIAIAPTERLGKGIYVVVMKQGDHIVRQRVIVKD